MLEDFIEVNSVSARILNKEVHNSSVAKCTLFVREPTRLKPLLVVHLANSSPKKEIIERLFVQDELHEAGAKEAFRITGYELEYMPPISIYGVIVIIDEKAAQKETLFFPIGEEKTLVISPKEIAEHNEDCFIYNVTGE